MARRQEPSRLVGYERISLVWSDLEEDQIGVVLMEPNEDTTAYAERGRAVPRAFLDGRKGNCQRPYRLEVDHAVDGRPRLLSSAPNTGRSPSLERAERVASRRRSIRSRAVPVVESSRLVLERWRDDDVTDLAAIGTAEVVRFLGGTPWTIDAARESIELWRQIENRLGITTWAVRLRGSGELVGTCGFAGTNAPWLRFDFVIEIGWTVGRTWWGQGIATEAASAALAYGQTRYESRRFISKCHIENSASERVMNRIGMRRVGVVQGAWPAPTIVARLP